MHLIYSFFGNRTILWLLFLGNVGGTVYGYIWYEPQLAETPIHFIPFVPDSPTASLFFVFVLLAFLLNRNWPLMEALAIVTLFKYGIWAVVMNLLTLKMAGYLPWQGYMLIASHAGMAIQGLLYSPFYRMKVRHLIIAGIWTLHNDVIDYVYMQYPKYAELEQFARGIGYFTFWLSVVSLAVAYYFSIRKQRVIWKLPFQ